MSEDGTGESPCKRMRPHYKLMNGWFCPYAQRAWISMRYKGISFELLDGLEMDNENVGYKKHPLLVKHNPNALVPTIIDENCKEGPRAIYESQVCMEFADDSNPQAPCLYPRDPFEKAQCKIKVDWINKNICSKFYYPLVRRDDDERRQAFSDLVCNLRLFADECKGPLYYGEELSAVDVALVPWAYRLFLLEHYRGPSYALDASDPAIAKFIKWREHVLSFDAVKGTLADKARLISVYKRYADATAKSKVGDAVRAGKQAHDI